MPLFDYVCSSCEASVELLVSRSEADAEALLGIPTHGGKTPCPACNKATLVRSAVQVPATAIFLGDGWAKDGYSSRQSLTTTGT